jgi:MoaA/NifB/PqqE/SkfB family radical SAM enzyme
LDSNRFLSIFMDQNNKCNLKCRMCGFSDPRVRYIPHYDMPFWLFEKIAREAFPFTNYLALSCLSEPLMTADLVNRLDIVGEYGVPFSEIITNGTLLTEKIISKMLDVPITRLGISLDGATAETYESIRIGSSFNRVISNIHLFNKMKVDRGSDFPHLRLLHVISESNIEEFPALLVQAESLNAQSVDFRTIIPIPNAQFQIADVQWFWKKIRECNELLSEWIRKTGVENVGTLRHQAEEIELFDATGEKIMCRRPWNDLAIHANGDAHPCMTWARGPAGNFAHESFDQIWNGEALEMIRGEFLEKRPGVDCQYCSIRKNPSNQKEDDFFFEMLNKLPPVRESSL